MCDQMRLHVEVDSRPTENAAYDELKQMFNRLSRTFAAKGRRVKSPYFIVLDGTDFVKDNPGREIIFDFVPYHLAGLCVLASAYSEHPFPFHFHAHILLLYCPPQTLLYLQGMGIENEETA